MFGPFTLGDSFRVYRLQRRGISLDPQRALIQPYNPLWEASLAFLTQHAMGQPTYVLYDPHDGEAFVQLRYRPHQAAADVTYVAPSLAENYRATNAWARLLEGACTEAARRGIQRVFANVLESSAEVEVFHQAGFTLYAGEDIYRRDGEGLAAAPSPGEVSLRPQRPEDWPAVQKLCVAVTPQRVRQAEGGIGLTMGWEKNCRRYVLPGDHGHELLAMLSFCAGVRGNWLRILIHPEARDLAEPLVRWGLGTLHKEPGQPIFCNVRQYEGGVRTSLEAAGFELYARRVLMGKHTVAWVKTPGQELVPALKGSAEPVPPAFRIKGESEFQVKEGQLATERDAS